MKTICVVEDDAGISHSLKLYLENSDFSVIIHESWEWAVELIQDKNPDLVILDINLPKKNGIDVCSELRALSSIPIIMLTARGGEMDKITGLEAWADDYIAKPFSPRELLARINTILRRTGEEAEAFTTLSFEDVTVNTETMEVNVGDNSINLTKNEYDLLEKIMQWGWKLVTRETLMKEVIGYDNYVYDRTIDTHIKNLRRKLWKKEMILTVRGKWYRLNT